MELKTIGWIAVIIFVIYYISNDMKDRKDLEQVSRQFEKINKEMVKATKEFSKAINEDFKMKEEVIKKGIIPTTEAMKNLEIDLNKTLKVFEDIPQIKIPQPNQTQEKQNIKIQMH